MSTALPPLDAYLKIGADLAQSQELKAESDRLNAEMSLPPICAGGPGSGKMPASGTEGQRSRFRQYSYDRPGSEQPAETRSRSTPDRRVG